jgi:hypothetical protein
VLLETASPFIFVLDHSTCVGKGGGLFRKLIRELRLCLGWSRGQLSSKENLGFLTLDFLTDEDNFILGRFLQYAFIQSSIAVEVFTSQGCQ